MATTQKLSKLNTALIVLNQLIKTKSLNLVKEDGRYVIINQDGRSVPLKISGQNQTPEPKKYIVKSKLLNSL